ncbi:Trk family potassium uptake protein [Candidatus Woesearchaeota archaeon]|nr:Trk family potassium uptake protein [Candidatus Woesearchaeota archaeon]
MAYDKVLAKKVNPVKAIAVSFLAIIAIGTLLLMMPFSSREGTRTGFVDALFTATSATTVTGLVVKDTHDFYSPTGQLIILFLIQIGGLGYMTFMSFLFIFARNMKLSGGMYMRESMNLPALGDVYKFAKHTVVFVLLFEIAGAVALTLIWSANADVKTAAKYGIFHSVSAFNNAGFDLFGGFSSLAGYAGNVWVNIAIISLTLAGGVGFLVIDDLWQKLRNRKRVLSLHTKIALTASVVLLLLGAATFYFIESGNEKTLGSLSMANKITISAFHSATARTSGFVTTNLDNVALTTLMLLGILMFIGSSPGGTGGGVKTTTVAIALGTAESFVKGKTDVEIFGRRISNAVITKSFVTIFAAAGVVTAASMLISLIEPEAFEKILFEAISAFSTTGMSTGITPSLSSAAKIILAAVMFIGRISPVALLHLFLARKTSQRTRLPEEDAVVG